MSTIRMFVCASAACWPATTLLVRLKGLDADSSILKTAGVALRKPMDSGPEAARRRATAEESAYNAVSLLFNH